MDLDAWNAAAIRGCEQEWLAPDECSPVHEPEDDGDEHYVRCDHCKQHAMCRIAVLRATDEYDEDEAVLCRRCYAEAEDAGDLVDQDE